MSGRPRLLANEPKLSVVSGSFDTAAPADVLELARAYLALDEVEHVLFALAGAEADEEES